jgi:hypothetical protein
VGVARRLLATLTRYLSARDVPLPEEAALLSAVARALASASGAAALAAASGAPASAALPPAVLPTLAASGAPGLLHTLLGVHVRMLLSAAATTRAPLALHRAVNVLHLLRVLLQQRGMASGPALRLFLPCVLRPLVQLLAAGTHHGHAQPAAGTARSSGASGGLLAAQLQVYKLVQQLLKQPGGMPLPALGLLAQDGGGGGGGGGGGSGGGGGGGGGGSAALFG